MPNTRMAIAIDGPAASGKSSTAKAIARALGYHHVDSGALYRAVTAARAREGGDVADWTEDSVLDASAAVSLSPTETGFTPLLNGEMCEEEMRSEAVTSKVSLVAKMPGVRDWVNSVVRETARNFDVVVDGRDIGTVVFPGARLKIFLDAAPGERAKRRLVERLGRQPSEYEIAEETGKIVLRDELDARQSVRAPDAVVIDTTHLSQEEQIARIIELLERNTP
ncbi:MAG TPA: (d)CMP kinase [Gemmatimonadaceae bacterium]|nr:(d)CMP kinase [Gemmatimonadaceae bacterium]